MGVINMPKVEFKGFSEQHRRNLCSVSFEDNLSKVKFESNFNMNFRNHQVQAEPDSFDSLTVNIVYITEVNDEVIKYLINQLVS